MKNLTLEKCKPIVLFSLSLPLSYYFISLPFAVFLVRDRPHWLVTVSIRKNQKRPMLKLLEKLVQIYFSLPKLCLHKPLQTGSNLAKVHHLELKIKQPCN